MLGYAGDDILEPGHKSLLAKVLIAHIGNHRLPVGIKAGFGVAFLGMLDMVERCVVIFALTGTDDPDAERTMHSG